MNKISDIQHLAFGIYKHIPNLITGMNAVSGTMAIFMAMYEKLELAAALILLAMVFDFFDGFAARLLHVKSEMGKELDSLADMVSFGVAPAVLAHFLIKMTLFEGGEEDISSLTGLQQVLLYVPLIIPAFSAYRLAKFNLDTRQAHTFIGMPTPANALFWITLIYGYYQTPMIFDCLFGAVWLLVVCVIALSILLVCELPMFSLKMAGFGWRENRFRYSYLGCLVILTIFFRQAIAVFIIPLYILLAVIEALWTTSRGR